MCSATKLPRKQHKLGTVSYTSPTRDLTRHRHYERGRSYDFDKYRLTSKIRVKRVDLLEPHMYDSQPQNTSMFAYTPWPLSFSSNE